MGSRAKGFLRPCDLKCVCVAGMQVLQQAANSLAVQADTFAALLQQSLQCDMQQPASQMSAMTSDLIDMWKQHVGTEWAEQLNADCAALLAQSLNRSQRRHETASIYELRVSGIKVCLFHHMASKQILLEALPTKCDLVGCFDACFVLLHVILYKCCLICRLYPPNEPCSCAHCCAVKHTSARLQACLFTHVQVVTETLWETAVAAYQHSSNINGMYQAWLWRQKHGQGWNWAPSQECYLFMVHAVTLLHHQPMEGQDFCNWVLLCSPNYSLHCTTTSPMATNNLYVA